MIEDIGPGEIGYTPTLPPSHLRRIHALRLRTVSYLNRATLTAEGNEWLPRDIIGHDGKTVIIYRRAGDTYSFDGWEPWHDGMFGGRRDNIHNALAWVERAIAIRAGKAKDFLGT